MHLDGFVPDVKGDIEERKSICHGYSRRSKEFVVIHRGIGV